MLKFRTRPRINHSVRVGPFRFRVMQAARQARPGMGRGRRAGRPARLAERQHPARPGQRAAGSGAVACVRPPCVDRDQPPSFWIHVVNSLAARIRAVTERSG